MTRNTYTGNGVTTDFTFSFPYLSQSHVLATINGVATTNFTFFSSSTLRFSSAPANGAAVVIYRSTPNSALLADFTAGSAIREQDLELDLQQNLYASQELKTFVEQQSTAGLQEQITTATNTANTALTAANANTTFTQSGTGAVSRSVTSKLKDTVSVKDFGAVGDGVTNDTAAYLAAISAAATSIYVPEGSYNCLTLAPTSITKQLIGPGRTILGGDNATHPVKNFAYVSGTPTTWSNVGDPAAAMSGEMVGKGGMAIQNYTAGANTAGQPTSGYVNRHDLGVINLNSVFNSGFNSSLSDTEGRTGVPQYTSYAIHLGKGDYFNYLAGGYVNNPDPNRNSHWLADPALTCLAGGLSAVTPSCNLALIELQVQDGGNNITASGGTFHLYRTAAIPSPNTKKYLWQGLTVNSRGTVALDSLYQGTGLSRLGIDFSSATFTDSNTALALKRGQSINFNSVNSSSISTSDGTAPGTTKIHMSETSVSVLTVVNNQTSLDVRETAVLPGASSTSDLGSSALRWKDVYAGGANIGGSGNRAVVISTTDTTGTTSASTKWEFTGSGSSNTVATFSVGSNYSILATSTNHPLIFGTNNTERFRLSQAGRLLVGTQTDGASKLVVGDDSIQVTTSKTPATATATGSAGQIAWDANYVYVCTAANTWKRSALTTW